jgi:small subunit ribosomal protein S7
MPRRNQATIRLLEPDSVYRSRLVQQLVNKVMSDGKKSLAEQITYDALALVGERTGNNPVEELEGAIKQLTPVLEVRSRRVGGATYQVPVEVPARRARTLAVRWMVEFARARGEKSMAERLPTRSLTPPGSRATPGSGRTTSTAWPRRTKRSRITAGRAVLLSIEGDCEPAPRDLADAAFAAFRGPKTWPLQGASWRGPRRRP